MDNIFLFFRSAEHVEKFKKYFNKQQENIASVSEIEKNGSLSFLNTKISRKNNKFFAECLHLVAFLAIFKVLFPNLLSVV